MEHKRAMGEMTHPKIDGVPIGSGSKRVLHQVTMNELSKLFDEKLGPINIGMRQIEQKIEMTREEIRGEIWEVRCNLQDEMQTIAADWQAEFNKIQFRMQAIEQRMNQVEKILGDSNFEGSSINAQKIEELEI
eukprot:12139774-Karenia_brevis.AAC.1